MPVSSAAMTAAVCAGQAGRRHGPMHSRRATIDSLPFVRAAPAADFPLVDTFRESSLHFPQASGMSRCMREDDMLESYPGTRSAVRVSGQGPEWFNRGRAI